LGEDHAADVMAARISNRFTKAGLSPPFHVRAAAQRFRDYPVEKVVAALDDWFRQHRFRYRGGSGDQMFGAMQEAIERACRPALGRVKAKPSPKPSPPRSRPAPQRSGRETISPTGIFNQYVDAVDEGGDWSTNVRGEPIYEERGESFNEDA
jgi:hypothetical protein